MDCEKCGKPKIEDDKVCLCVSDEDLAVDGMIVSGYLGADATYERYKAIVADRDFALALFSELRTALTLVSSAPQRGFGQAYIDGLVKSVLSRPVPQALSRLKAKIVANTWREAAQVIREWPRTCNCAAVDIGVGIQHEPMCGQPNPHEQMAEYERRAVEAELRAEEK